jgi:four helix bundle protein
MLPYERFEAWRLCHRLALETYRITETFPRREMYGLASQARRAAFSAAASIAEGSAKRGAREFRRYLDIALGSLAELSYVLRLAQDLGFIGADQAAGIADLRGHASVVTWKLYNSVRRVTPTAGVP